MYINRLNTKQVNESNRNEKQSWSGDWKNNTNGSMRSGCSAQTSVPIKQILVTKEDWLKIEVRDLNLVGDENTNNKKKTHKLFMPWHINAVTYWVPDKDVFRSVGPKGSPDW